MGTYVAISVKGQGTNLSLEDAQVYDKLKNAIYLAYEMVPEHYQQNFRIVRKTYHETFVDFVHKQERLFKRWLLAEKAETKSDVETLVLMEVFKNTLDKPLKTHLTDLKTRDLMEAARMADKYALSHKTSGAGTRDNETRHNPSTKSYQSKGHRFIDRGRNSDAPNQGAFANHGPDSQSNNTSRGGSGNYDSRGNRGSSSNVSGMRCSFCHSPTHKVADCYRRKNQDCTTEKKECSKDKPPVENQSVTLIAREVLPVGRGSLGKGGTNIKSRDSVFMRVKQRY